MQRPLVHGTALQQSLFMVQLWPYSAQVPPSGGGGGISPSVVLPSGGGPASGGGGNPQTPREEPGGIVQGSPGQQSAPVEQVPPLRTHSPPQTKGGTPASAVNAGLGTQAKPQQSALLAHASPALEPPSPQGFPSIVQRGIPRVSCWQTNGF
jgi:hypothetical protein